MDRWGAPRAWHQHGCRIYRQPKSRPEFWLPKLQGNVRRDHENQGRLREMGWGYLVVWECEAKRRDTAGLAERLVEFLGPRATEGRCCPPG